MKNRKEGTITFSGKQEYVWEGSKQDQENRKQMSQFIKNRNKELIKGKYKVRNRWSEYIDD